MHEIMAPGNSIGVIVAINGSIAGMGVHGSQQLFTKVRYRVLVSYFQEAAVSCKPDEVCSEENAVQFLSSFSRNASIREVRDMGSVRFKFGGA